MYPGPYNFVGNCYAEAGRIKSMLPAHGRTELQAGNLGDCKPLVGGLRRPGQQGLLADRLLFERRVDAVLPRKSKRPTPKRQAVSITAVWIFRLSSRKSAG